MRIQWGTRLCYRRTDSIEGRLCRRRTQRSLRAAEKDPLPNNVCFSSHLHFLLNVNGLICHALSMSRLTATSQLFSHVLVVLVLHFGCWHTQYTIPNFTTVISALHCKLTGDGRRTTQHAPPKPNSPTTLSTVTWVWPHCLLSVELVWIQERYLHRFAAVRNLSLAR